MRKKVETQDEHRVETPAKIGPMHACDRALSVAAGSPRGFAASTGCNGWPITAASTITSCSRAAAAAGLAIVEDRGRRRA